MTKRRAIIEASRTRARAILVADGFATDAGAQVFLNEAPPFGENDPDVGIAMLIGVDENTWQNGKLLIKFPLSFQAIARADIGDPHIAAENVLGDIKKAFELSDRKLGGLLNWDIERGQTVTLERPEGGEYVGVAITYWIRYSEKWGDPSA